MGTVPPPEPADDHHGQLTLPGGEAVPGPGDHDAGERADARRIPTERLDERPGGPVEILVATADDDGHGQANRAQRRPARGRVVVREHVLRLSRLVEADVPPGAEESPRTWHERPSVAAGRPPRGRPPAAGRPRA